MPSSSSAMPWTATSVFRRFARARTPSEPESEPESESDDVPPPTSESEPESESERPPPNVTSPPPTSSPASFLSLTFLLSRASLSRCFSLSLSALSAFRRSDFTLS